MARLRTCARGSRPSWHRLDDRNAALAAAFWYVLPPGINLDSRGDARIGVGVRGLAQGSAWSPSHSRDNLIEGQQCRSILESILTEENVYDCLRPREPFTRIFGGGDCVVGAPGVPNCNSVSDPLFAASVSLAERSSYQWLLRLEVVMMDAGLNAFWQQVKTIRTLNQRTSQFEQYDRFPFQFLSAGEYPPRLDVNPDQEECFVRVTLGTSTDADSGTDADIYLKARNQQFLLNPAGDGKPGSLPARQHGGAHSQRGRLRGRRHG